MTGFVVEMVRFFANSLKRNIFLALRNFGHVHVTYESRLIVPYYLVVWEFA